MKAFHGTSADNLESILKIGLRPDKKPNWTASEAKVYLWGVDLMPDVETYEEQKREAKICAAYSAEPAIIKAKDCRRLIIECEVGDEWEPDETSENIASAGAICVPEVQPKQIIKIYRDEQDLSFYRGYFAACFLKNEYACEIDLSNVERQIIKAMQAINSNEGFCEIFEFLCELEEEMQVVYFKNFEIAS
jgi:hypothetical protein